MFDTNKNLAPEPQFSTYLWVLEQAIIHVRQRVRAGKPMPDEQLHDLMDAIHNVPKFLSEYGGWYVEENIRAAFAAYDELWGNAKDDSPGFRLVECLSMALEQMKQTDQYGKRTATRQGTQAG